jgi:hypothetical protein
MSQNGWYTQGDPRSTQARHLWELGFGRNGHHSLESYLASIPEVPERFEHRDPRFSHLILVDPRDGINRACGFAGLRCEANERAFDVYLPYWGDRPKDAAYWIICNDGRERHRQIEHVRFCHEKFDKDEHALTLEEGICLYAQRPRVTKNFTLVLAGTYYSIARNQVASIDKYRTVCVTSESGEDSGFPTRLR